MKILNSDTDFPETVYYQLKLFSDYNSSRNKQSIRNVRMREIFTSYGFLNNLEIFFIARMNSTLTVFSSDCKFF